LIGRLKACPTYQRRLKETDMKYVLMVRYGAMRLVGKFSTDVANLHVNERIVCRTRRGNEEGDVVSRSEIVDDNAIGDCTGVVLRRLTQADAQRLKQLQEEVEPRAYRFCKNCIEELDLPMKLVRVEQLLGSDKIVFYFLADGRVDFRQLVKMLASEYKTRIEMHQIGVRDEARLLAEVEHCGRELCCRTFIKDLEPVTMRMAKMQKSTLDPAKISGRCGRLMCCLRFEDETYTYLKNKLPRKGTRVTIADGTGEVAGYDILRQTVDVYINEGKMLTVPVGEIITSEGDKKEKQPGQGRSRGRRNRRKGKKQPSKGSRKDDKQVSSGNGNRKDRGSEPYRGT